MIDYTKRPKGSQPSTPQSNSGGINYTKPPKSTTPPAATPTPSTGSVNLSKVTLTKSAPSVSLTKDTGAGGHMRVNLNWGTHAPAPQKGFLNKMKALAAQPVDLDLGCLWETRDGDKGVIQALGGMFGSLHTHPYVHLDGDDRSGAAVGGENLIVNLDHISEIKRILIFAYVYEGAGSFADIDGMVTMYPRGAAPIEIRLDEPSNKKFCALALLESDGHNLKINREIRYIAGNQSDLDRAYGWGMNWTPGTK